MRLSLACVCILASCAGSPACPQDSRIGQDGPEVTGIVRLGDRRFSHGAIVRFGCFSPDGKVLTTATEKGFIHLWEYPEGKLLRRLPAHQGLITALCPSAGGGIVTGGVDRRIRLLSEPGGSIETVGETVATIDALAVRPDATVAYAAVRDGIEVWNLRDRKKIDTLRGHKGGTQALALTSDARILISGGMDGMIRGVELSSGTDLFRISTAGVAVTSIDIAHDGSHFAAGLLGGEVGLWDLPTGKDRASLGAATKNALSLKYSNSGKLLVLGTVSGEIQIFHTSPYKEQQSIRTDVRSRTAAFVVLTPDERGLVSQLRADGVLELWSLPDGKESLHREGPSAAIRTLAISPSGDQVAAGAVDGSLTAWDVATSKQILKVKAHSGAVNDVHFYKGKFLVSAGGDKAVRVWTRDSGKLSGEQQAHSDAVTAVAFFPDDDIVFSTGRDGKLLSWNFVSGEVREKPPVGAATIRNMMTPVSAAGLLAIGGERRRISLRKAPEWDESAFLAVEEDIRSLSCSADGSLLGAATATSLYGWDLESRRLKFRIRPPSTEVLFNSIAVSPDGQFVAAGGSDGAIRVYSALTAKQLHATAAHFEGANAVAFSSDGKWLASGGDDTTVALIRDVWSAVEK